jgi:hypothetical protein
MVSNIVPGATGANVLGVDPRLSRPPPSSPDRREHAGQDDRVELSAASFALARESVRAGIVQLHEALALGHEAQAMLLSVKGLAGSGDASAQSELQSVLAAFAERVEGAIARGARVAAGEVLSVQAEPGGEPVSIAGVDLRLKAAPAAGDVIAIPAAARADDAALASMAQRSLEALQQAMSRLLDSTRALEAHHGFLGAVEGASHVRSDLDADGARLLALQVRQGLEGAGASIANVEPQAVLSLFRA